MRGAGNGPFSGEFQNGNKEVTAIPVLPRGSDDGLRIDWTRGDLPVATEIGLASGPVGGQRFIAVIVGDVRAYRLRQIGGLIGD